MIIVIFYCTRNMVVYFPLLFKIAGNYGVDSLVVALLSLP